MIPYNIYEIEKARGAYLQEGHNRERLADIARGGSAQPTPLVKLMSAVRHLIGDQPASETRSTNEIIHPATHG